MDDDYLKEEIQEQWKILLDRFPSDEMTEEIMKIIKQDSDYPNYNTDDIRIGIRNYLNRIIDNSQRFIFY
jgi:hypothetical protein